MATQSVTAPLYLDTHVLVWLYQEGAARLTEQGARLIEAATPLLISPIVELELTYLHEISRIQCSAATILDVMRRDVDLQICTLPFTGVVGAAVSQTWTRDPFDRLIVAQAAYGQARLLTADRHILGHYSLAIW